MAFKKGVGIFLALYLAAAVKIILNHGFPSRPAADLPST